jgi:hypothetical protein
MGNYLERRKGERYPLRLHMHIVAADSETMSVPAYTANISRTGVLFQCHREFELGQELQYVIDLYPDCSVQLKGTGRVVRWAATGPIEQLGSRLLAVTVERFECLRESQTRGNKSTPVYV